jgi:hypothetical protein
MATCAILGQALGTAVAMAIAQKVHIEKIDIPSLQQALMDDDCYIPWHSRSLSELTKTAICSSEAVRNGVERGDANLWIGSEGDTVEYSFDTDTRIKEIRLVFDNDMNRKYHNMPCCYPLVETKFKLPTTLIREYIIEGINEAGEIFSFRIKNNHQRLVKHSVDMKIKKLRFIPISTYGCDKFRLFGFEVK